MFAFEVAFELGDTIVMMAKSSLFACLKGDNLAIITIDIFGAKNVDNEDG